MQNFRVLSALLCYPDEALIAALPELEAALATQPNSKALLRPVLKHLKDQDMIALQEQYVATFDRNPSHSLHLFEHIHGESRDRGQAMVDLLQEYKREGFDMVPNELPDYVPLFLEFLSQIAPDKAQSFLGDAVHVLAHLGGKLKASGSPYACVLDVAILASPVAPLPLSEPPIRDMEEVMETFGGGGVDGNVPLLKPSSAVTPVHFYPNAGSPRV